MEMRRQTTSNMVVSVGGSVEILTRIVHNMIVILMIFVTVV